MKPLRYRTIWLASLAALLISWPNQSWAESAPPRSSGLGGVEGTGIEQGTGAITTRSEVSIAVESIPGTPALRLQAIGNVIGTKMGAIRLCYIDTTRARPTTEGELRVRVEVQRGRATFTTIQDSVDDRQLSTCVLRELRSASFADLQEEAGGMVVMDFSNSAAAGVAAVERDREQAPERDVQIVDGRAQANSQTSGGEVELTITGNEGVSVDAVSALYRNVQARVGSLLDCRRRASRRGMSPAGEMTVALRVPPRGAALGRRQASTVAFPQAPQCVIRALVQAVRGEPEAAGSYRVVIRFAE